MAVRQYIGARYVPEFASPLDWDNSKTYEPLTIVYHEGNSYTSRQSVPTGIDINNEEYWALTGNYNAQIEQYRQEVTHLAGSVDENAKQIANIGEELDSTNKNVAANTENIAAIIAERKSNYVTYSDFGAVLDGLSDDSQAVKAAHEFANENGCMVIQQSGKLLANFTVQVKTSCILNIELIVNQSTPDTVYSIEPGESEQVIFSGSVSPEDESAWNTGLYGKSGVIHCENENWNLGTRSEHAMQYWHHQPVAFDQQGKRVSSPIYVANSGTFTVKNVQSLYQDSLNFEGLRIVANYNGALVNFQNVVKCSRNNTVIKNISCEIVNLPNSGIASVAGGGLIYIEGCANVVVENVTANNNSSSVATTYSYLLNIWESFHVIIRNSMLNGGWGSVSTAWVDTLVFDNVVSNRFDNHYGIFGLYTIENCRLTGLATVGIGYGNAAVCLCNTVVECTQLGTVSYFYSRSEFPEANVLFCGTFKVQNVKVTDVKNDDGSNVFAFVTTDVIKENFPANDARIIIDNLEYHGKRWVFRSATTYTNKYKVSNYTGSLNVYGLFEASFTNCTFDSFASNLLQADTTAELINCAMPDNMLTLNGTWKLIGCSVKNMTTNNGSGAKLLYICSCVIGDVSITGQKIVMIGNNVSSGFTPTTYSDRVFIANNGLADYPAS